MTRLHRTRKESIHALHGALTHLWSLVHTEHRDFASINLSDISRKHRISSLPASLIKPCVLCERQPTLAAAAELRETLSYNARGKGGHRMVKASTNPQTTAQRPKYNVPRTLFNFNNYDAVEEINQLFELLSNAGFTSYGAEVNIRENDYTIKLEIIRQTQKQ